MVLLIASSLIGGVTAATLALPHGLLVTALVAPIAGSASAIVAAFGVYALRQAGLWRPRLMPQHLYEVKVW